MGNTLGTDDRPVYDDTGDHVNDLQAAADYTKKHAFVRSGTAADRAGLAAGQMPNGMLFSETDTGLVWLRRSGAWTIAGGRAVACVVKKSATTAVAAGPAAMIWSTTGAVFDSDEFYDTASNTRLTVPFSGVYEVSWAALTNSASTAITTSEVYVNGSASGYKASQDIGVPGKGAGAQGTVLLDLNAGDYIEVRNTTTSPAGNWTVDSYVGIKYLGEI